MLHRAWLAATLLSLMPLAASNASPQPMPSGVTLWSLTHGRSDLDSFEIFHVSDTAAFRTNWTISRLTASQDGVEDFLHISRERVAAKDLVVALSRTAVIFNQKCRDLRQIDVRWAFLLRFQDHSRAVIAFNRNFNCVQLESEPVPVGLDGAFFSFVERDFGFLIDRYYGDSKGTLRKRLVRL